MHARTVVLMLALAGVAAGSPPAAAAQPKGDPARDYPSRPIRVIVPFGIGSITDILTRSIMPKVSETLGQSIIVDNRSGAGGNIGTDLAVKGIADGGAGSTRFGAWMRPGSDSWRADTTAIPTRAFTVASP